MSTGASGPDRGDRWGTGTFLVAAALLFAVFVLGSEGLGRVWMHTHHGVPGKTYGRWRADAVLGSRLGENRYDQRWRTNNLGFRNNEDLIEPRRGLRIITYGGSTTLCWNLPTAETWPAQLEQRLRQASGNNGHQVLNAGDILWPIGRILKRARTEIPALRPDYVFIMTGINEVPNARLLALAGTPMKSLVERGQFGEFRRDLPQDHWLFRNSIAFKIVLRFVLQPLSRHWRHLIHDPWSKLLVTDIDAAHPVLPPDPYILQNYLHVLRDLIQVCRDNGAVPVFIREAHCLNTVGIEHTCSYSREGVQVAQELGVQVVDAQAMVDAWPGNPKDLFYGSGIHYLTHGAAMLADTIFSQVFAHREGFAPRR